MTVTQKTEAARPVRNSWREELTESKIDMGLLDVCAPGVLASRLHGVLKNWDARKSPAPEIAEEKLRETGT
jgi:hypothetical protein